MQTYLKNGYIVSMDQQDTVFDGVSKNAHIKLVVVFH